MSVLAILGTGLVTALVGLLSLLGLTGVVAVGFPALFNMLFELF